MLNRFRKMLSILCVAALLLSCLPASFADTAEILEETQVTETVDPVETSQEESISEEVAASAETSEEVTSEDKEEAPGANPAEDEVSTDTPVVPAADESGVTEESASQPEEPEAEPTQPEEPETTAPAEEETSVQNDENKPEFVSDPVQIEPEEEKEPEQVTEPEQEAEPEQPAQPADPVEPEKQPETAQPETEQPEAEQPETAEPETESEEDTDNPYTLRLGRGYLMCPLKANEKFEVAFHSKWNRTILATLTLSPKEGETLAIPDPDSEDKIIRVWIGEEEMELTLVENEDPEFKGLTFQFLTYIENGKDYTFTLLASQDAEAGLHAIKKPEAEKEDTSAEDAETADVRDDNSDNGDAGEGTVNDNSTAITEASNEEMLLQQGYNKVQILMKKGADVFSAMDENAEIVAHLDLGDELWIKPTNDRAWAEIYDADEGKEPAYILWDTVLITSQAEKEEIPAEDAEVEKETDTQENTEQGETEEPLRRSVILSSNLDGLKVIDEGTIITITATLNGFHEDDQYEINWAYSSDNGESFQIIEGANELTYSYPIDEENAHNIWRIIISLE